MLAIIFCAFWTLASIASLVFCFLVHADWRTYTASITMVLCWGLETFQSYKYYKIKKELR